MKCAMEPSLVVSKKQIQVTKNILSFQPYYKSGDHKIEPF